MLGRHPPQGVAERHLPRQADEWPDNLAEHGVARVRFRQQHHVLERYVADDGLGIPFAGSDRKPGVEVHVGDDQILAERGVGDDHHDVVLGEHDFPDLDGREATGLDDDSLFLHANDFARPEEVDLGPQFVQANVLVAAAGRDQPLEQGHGDVGDPFQHPDRRIGDDAKEPHHGAEDRDHQLAVFDGEDLGDELADDDHAGREGNHHASKSEQIGPGRGKVNSVFEVGDQPLFHVGSPRGSGDGAADGQPELHHGQAFLHPALHPQGGGGPAAALLDHVPEPLRADGGQGPLISGEDAVEQEHDEDDEEDG